MRFITIRSQVKPCLVRVFQVVAKSNLSAKAGKGHILFRPGHIR